METEQKAKKQKKPHIKIRMCFFVIGLLFLCTEASLGIGLSRPMQRWVFIPLYILVLLVPVLLYRKAGSFLASRKFLMLIVLVYVSMYGMLASQLNQMEHHAGVLSGANANVFSYTDDIFAKSYSSADEILKNTKLDAGYREFYRFEDSHAVSVFYQKPAPKHVKKGSYQEEDPFYMALKVLSVDIYKEGGRYYAVGTRKMSAASFDSYSDEETLRADLSASLSRKSVMPQADKLFVWGVSRYPHMDRVTVDGIPCAKIISLSLRGGNTGYFWIISNINAGLNPKTVSIKGLPNTNEK
ncbi:hypothetical protein HMP0721_2112 [Pseudoramibacter alactolyticus ATCC 23263]|uniref:Uncharacterized protein n=1 Tax=Pseudoramibacter alactolyticus ATCC 23263 TaxID=887929 RepID=E6MJC7_9FIRM|nr:hypothetical protein [Pseudoramibacter alactolyticus]EFV00804.1 hypothetical protein HMP0721_2112 [Pseudoramibacter alactolyticus ATCC 23263]